MAEPAGVADPVDAVNLPSGVLDDLMVSADTIEGITVFAQQRKPVWRNR